MYVFLNIPPNFNSNSDHNAKFPISITVHAYNTKFSTISYSYITHFQNHIFTSPTHMYHFKILALPKSVSNSLPETFSK